jgi:hypothetical protein
MTKVLKFTSKYLDKTYHIRKVDMDKAITNNHQVVKYCKSNGEYHKEVIGDFRYVHIGNLDQFKPQE